MNLWIFYTWYFARLSCALSVPVNNAINLVPRTESELSTDSRTLGAINPNFKVSNPIVLQAPIQPLAVYMNAIAALAFLATSNYYGQQAQGVISEPGYQSVSIALVPHDSPYITRYYAIWGIYYAVCIMSTTGVFKESQFNFLFNGNLVGRLAIGPTRSNSGANNGEFTALGNLKETALLSEYGGSIPEPTLANATLPLNLTSATWSTIPEPDRTNLQPNAPTDQIYTIPSTNLATPTENEPSISIRYKFDGETILPNRVYLTFMECFASSGIAIPGVSDLVPPEIAFNSPLYNTHIYARKMATPLPPARGPQWTYGFLSAGLAAMPQVMVTEKDFREISATVLVDAGSGNVPVGTIWLKSGRMPGVAVGGVVATA